MYVKCRVALFDASVAVKACPNALPLTAPPAPMLITISPLLPVKVPEANVR